MCKKLSTRFLEDKSHRNRDDIYAWILKEYAMQSRVDFSGKFRNLIENDISYMILFRITVWDID